MTALNLWFLVRIINKAGLTMRFHIFSIFSARDHSTFHDKTYLQHGSEEYMLSTTGIYGIYHM